MATKAKPKVVKPVAKAAPKAEAKPKKVAKSVTEVAFAPPVAEAPVAVPPSEWFDYEGVVGKPNADGTVTLYRRENSVQSTEVVEGVSGTPISKQEAYLRAF